MQAQIEDAYTSY